MRSSPQVSSRRLLLNPSSHLWLCSQSSLGAEIREQGRRALGAISINLSHTWLFWLSAGRGDPCPGCTTAFLCSAAILVRLCNLFSAPRREHPWGLLKPVCDGWGMSCGVWWTSAHIWGRTFYAQHILYIIHNMPGLHMHTQQFPFVHGFSNMSWTWGRSQEQVLSALEGRSLCFSTPSTPTAGWCLVNSGETTASRFQLSSNFLVPQHVILTKKTANNRCVHAVCDWFPFYLASASYTKTTFHCSRLQIIPFWQLTFE